MPDKTGLLIRVRTTVYDLNRGSRLVLSKDRFLELIVLLKKENPLFDEGDKCAAVKEGLDCLLIAFRLIALPVEDEFSPEVPGDSVEVLDQVSDVEYLRGSEHLRRL